MPSGRRARLTLSRIDPWTVLRFSLLLYVCFYLILMVAGTALWIGGTATGLRDNIESFVGDLISSPDFKFLGGRILQASVLGGAAMVMVGAGANVLMAVLYNLISDVVGGVGVTLDEPARPDGAAARPDRGGRTLRRRDRGVMPKPVRSTTPLEARSGGDQTAASEDGGAEPDEDRTAAVPVSEAAGDDSGSDETEVTGIAKV